MCGAYLRMPDLFGICADPMNVWPILMMCVLCVSHIMLVVSNVHRMVNWNSNVSNFTHFGDGINPKIISLTGSENGFNVRSMWHVVRLQTHLNEIRLREKSLRIWVYWIRCVCCYRFEARGRFEMGLKSFCFVKSLIDIYESNLMLMILSTNEIRLFSNSYWNFGRIYIDRHWVVYIKWKINKQIITVYARAHLQANSIYFDSNKRKKIYLHQ